jgi:hypothetical protein
METRYFFLPLTKFSSMPILNYRSLAPFVCSKRGTEKSERMPYLRDKESTDCLSAKKQAERPLIAKKISNIGLVNLTPCQKARPSIFRRTGRRKPSRSSCKESKTLN